jgi:hypothetical protein
VSGHQLLDLGAAGRVGQARGHQRAKQVLQSGGQCYTPNVPTSSPKLLLDTNF